MAKILDTNKPNSVIEYFLGTNEFNRPTVYTDVDATYTLLIRLILLLNVLVLYKLLSFTL